MEVLLIGCGRMGGALARGWRASHRVLAFDPMADALPDGVERIEALEALAPDDARVIVLAVKPQSFAHVAPALRPLAMDGALIVSIMAGVTLAGLEAALDTRRAIRAMPNTPAAIGRGITAAIAGPGTRAGDRDLARDLLRPAGDVVWAEAEAQMDAITALSGSGPAYFFRFAEALAAAGGKAGLSPDLAMRLARATFTGAAALAEADPAALDELRRQVTSPGGTTAAGLAVMDAGKAIDRLAADMLTAAAARSRELAH
ncbi:pyrroline-5-carboxylate reductase [Sphingomonas sp.]|uniref:pyrroline-5-carboxylate reductase n=1 Tax=Sphingomonas sp. TaxID=28214 RepID=UPI001EC0B3E8|nr:pyrroline-5-carboxylate reductase [Sphingomonas sp.]MBX3594603.1 pyrroline-5-carboxylate reductase [Sphingomonas sp.]